MSFFTLNNLELFSVEAPPDATSELFNDKWEMINRNFEAISDIKPSSSVDLNDGDKLASSAAVYKLAQAVEANTEANQSMGLLLASDNPELNDLQKVVDFIEELKAKQQSISSLLESDNPELDDFQKIVDFIEDLKSNQESLGISSINGLQDRLDQKASTDLGDVSRDAALHSLGIVRGVEFVGYGSTLSISLDVGVEVEHVFISLRDGGGSGSGSCSADWNQNEIVLSNPTDRGERVAYLAFIN